MEMPIPDAALDVLARLAGDWRGSEKIYPLPSPKGPSPEACESSSEISAELQIGGFFLISNYRQFSGDQTTFEGHGVYGWDAPKERYTMHWFDSTGVDPGPPVLGRFQDKRLEVRRESPASQHRYVYAFLSEDAYTFKMAMSQDGESWQPLLEGSYERR